MLKNTLKRLATKRIEIDFKGKSESLNGGAYLGLGGISSAVMMAAMLTISSPNENSFEHDHAAHIHGPQPYEAELTEGANIRDALVSAWKELELDDPQAHVTSETQEPANAAETPAEETAKAPPEITYPIHEQITVKVRSGDTMDKILQRQKIGIEDTHAIIKAMKKHFNPRKIKVDQQFTLDIERASADKTLLKKFEVKTGKLSRVEVKPEGSRFVAEKVETKTTRQLAKAGGTITSSFYEAGDDAGLPRAITSELVKAYSYDVDFQRDIKPGQKLDVLFEQLVSKEDGSIVGHGDLKYAAFKLGRKNVEIYKYKDRHGNSGYYKPNGESVRKALLKTPVNARISSKFGMRKHPILKYSKMHKGIDFAARTGTPIYAAGDGVVNFKGRKGGYGNYIRIKHNGTYQTAYAHLHKFAKGMRNGKRVKQGQVIGYVGSTGRSTGPHLHYEILKHGKHINPNGAKFRTGRVLKGKELAAFKKQKQKLKNQFASLPRIREQVAQADSQ